MSDSSDHGQWRHIVRRLVAAGRWIAKRDELPTLEPVPSSGRSIKDAPAWLTAPGSLPLKTRPDHEPRRTLGWLLSPEPLPNADPRDGSGTGSILRWLLKSEKLPRRPADPPPKEASYDEA
jgi:hypothetical protein